MKHIFHIEFSGLHDTITSSHSCKDYRLGHTVQNFRNSFEDGEIRTIKEVPSAGNIADGLRKKINGSTEIDQSYRHYANTEHTEARYL